MTTYRAPLAEEDAETIAHTIEVRTLSAADVYSTILDTARYGEARRWLSQLLQGKEVEIPEPELAASRRIMTRRIG